MAYDSSISSFTTKTDKVDLVLAAHLNTVQSELVTIETILGTNVKGDRADLKTRLNNALDADGSLFSGTSFPSPSLPSQGFYRTDLDLYYIMNAGNSAWNQVGQSLSSSLFAYSGQINTSSTDFGFYTGTNLNIATGTLNYAYWVGKGTSYGTVIQAKWKKIAGVATVTIYANFWCQSNTAYIKVDIGGSNGETTTASSTPQWGTFTIDVSGLSNGTVYDVVIQLKNGSVSNWSYLGSIIAFGS